MHTMSWQEHNPPFVPMGRKALFENLEKLRAIRAGVVNGGGGGGGQAEEVDAEKKRPTPFAEPVSSRPNGRERRRLEREGGDVSS